MLTTAMTAQISSGISFLFSPYWEFPLCVQRMPDHDLNCNRIAHVSVAVTWSLRIVAHSFQAIPYRERSFLAGLLPGSYAVPGRLVGLSALKTNAAAAPPSNSATM